MAAKKISSDSVTADYPVATGGRETVKARLTPEERQASLDAEIWAAARRAVALAPPPSERQLAALRRLTPGSPERVQARLAAEERGAA